MLPHFGQGLVLVAGCWRRLLLFIRSALVATAGPMSCWLALVGVSSVRQLIAGLLFGVCFGYCNATVTPAQELMSQCPVS